MVKFYIDVHESHGSVVVKLCSCVIWHDSFREIQEEEEDEDERKYKDGLSSVKRDEMREFESEEDIE